MKTSVKILLMFALLAIMAAISVKTGLARQVFYELFARVKGVEVLGPTVVRVPPLKSPYQRWLQQVKTEIPVYEELVIHDINNIQLRDWPQMGEDVTGLYLHFADYQMSDGRLLELPAGGKTISQRHLYEKGIYFLGGPGHTIIQQEGEKPMRVDWNTGSLFSVPLNVRHQHFNDSNQPVRFLAITSFPFVLNAIDSERFIEDNAFVFEDRYTYDEHYFDYRKAPGAIFNETNLVDDVLSAETNSLDIRGKGNKTMRWFMAGNSMLSLHISEMPPKIYKKAHRHSSDAFILVLSGEGYSLTWPEDNYHKRQRIDWQAGTLFVPPTYWYHQHLNSGATPARYLAINVPGLVMNLGLRFSDQLETDLPEIRREWQQELGNRSH
jgi:gentisate 1,2-dioxygenase